jgi:hypothetical protein
MGNIYALLTTATKKKIFDKKNNENSIRKQLTQRPTNIE